MTHPSKARFLVIGGFLGAGKTTALLRLAQMYDSEGKKVGLITNDQAAHLVDTGTLRIKGFRVEEVAGACFCCKFDELAQRAEKLREDEKPDVLIGEPVGSCTDLAATVVQPLKKLFADRYEIAPYSVLVDPVRACQIVIEKGFGGFSSRVAYIFLKQLEEADVICLNKIDLLNNSERKQIAGALAQEFPKARIILISGSTGEGFDTWRNCIEPAGQAVGRNIAQVDYDIYAAGEAELGWLNATYHLEAKNPFPIDELLTFTISNMVNAVAARAAEAAHLKAMIETDRETAVVNYVGANAKIHVSQPTNAAARLGTLTINARIHLDPALIRSIADDAVRAAMQHFNAAAHVGESLHFRPGRPVPTHRFARAEV